jgi:hypothetical protein
MILSKDQRLLSPVFLDIQFFPAGTQIWLDDDKRIIAAKLADETSLTLFSSTDDDLSIYDKPIFPADSLAFFNGGHVPCALVDGGGYFYDITEVLELGAENPYCLSAAFSLSPLPL